MPGKPRGTAKRIRGGRPAARPKGVASRAKAKPAVRRSANIKRTQVRNVQRTQARKRANEVNPRSRPVVRPTSAPKRAVARPRPTPVRKQAPKPTRSVRPSPCSVKRSTGRAVGTAMAAAAVGSLIRLNVASAAPEISNEVSYLQSSIDDLQSRANMTDVRADVNNLDANLNHALNLLESARDKKFMYQADLEDIAYDAMSRWQAIRKDVEANIERQASLSNRTLQPVGNSIQRLNSVLSNASRAQSVLGSVQVDVQSALNAISDAESTIEGSYQDIESQTYQLTSRLTQIHWAITQRDEASFEFIKDEDLFMAVKARWDREGKDDPEGVLFLTNKRLIFERKEKIATKKVLFVTTSSELVQEVMGAKPLNEVKDIKAQSKGLFGHQDFLEVDFGGQKIPFHLDGQNSEEWAVWIKDAKSGKIEDQRASGTGLHLRT